MTVDADLLIHEKALRRSANAEFPFEHVSQGEFLTARLRWKQSSPARPARSLGRGAKKPC